MKADLAAILVIGVVAAAIGGIYVQAKMEEALPPDARYERDLDAMVDRKLEAAGLDFLQERLSPQGSARLRVLEALYDDRETKERLNRGFSAMRGDWVTSYTRFAEEAGREYEDGRLEAEIDERMGDGVYDVMVRQYEATLDRRRPRRPIDIVDRGPRGRLACERTARELQALVICNTPDGRYTVDGRR